MASTGKKIFLGCGIGCLLLLIVVGGVGTCSVLGIKKLVDEADTVEVVYDDLARQHGAPTAFTPSADGVIQAGRVRLFLAARDSVATRSAKLSHALRTIDGGDGGGSGTVAKVRAGLDLLPALIRHRGAHSGALLEAGLGLGEHTYLYALSFYVLLGHNPGEGPDFKIQDRRSENRNVHWSYGDDTDSVAGRAFDARREFNRILRSVLKNQRSALGTTLEYDPWAARLDEEIAAMRVDPQRLPWEDGLPEPIAASLAPFRDELAARWDAYLNAMEIVVLSEESGR